MTRTGRPSGYARTVAVAFILASCLVASPPAEAFSITQIGTSGGNPGGQPVYEVTGLVEGDSFTMSVNQTLGPDTLNATAIISVFAIGDGFTLIDIDLSNGSSGANRITHFGMAIKPDALGGSIVDIGGNTDTDAFTGFGTSNFAGFQLVEFCASSGSNCAGGGSGGLLSGQQDLFRFSLTDGFKDGGTIDLSQFALKLQGGANSYQLAGQPDEPNGQVPQPMGLILLGVGLIGLTAVSTVRSRMRGR